MCHSATTAVHVLKIVHLLAACLVESYKCRRLCEPARANIFVGRVDILPDREKRHEGNTRLCMSPTKVDIS